MKNLYYKIWVDAILKIKENPLRKEDWRWIVQALMGMLLSINIIFIMALLQRNIFNIYFYTLNINYFNNKKNNLLFDFFILYYLPSLIINYLLIFRKKKIQFTY